MKNILLFVLLLGTISHASEVKDTLVLPFKYKVMSECDACGCSASGGGMGFNSLLNANFVGLRYFYQNYSAKSGVYGNSPWADDTFNSYILQSRFTPFKRFEVSAQITYHNNQRILANLDKTNGDQTINGIGDGVLIGFYSVVNTMNADSITIKQKINLGLGLKVPTGKFQTANAEGNNPAFQLGTGSWDYILAFEHIIKREKIGLNTMINYVIKTENKNNYQFGNQLNYGSSVFYSLETRQVTWVPQAGFSGETYKANKFYSDEVKNSAGDIIFGKIGLDIGFKKWSIATNFFSPINQNLMNGNLVAKNRFSIQLNYAL